MQGSLSFCTDLDLCVKDKLIRFIIDMVVGTKEWILARGVVFELVTVLCSCPIWKALASYVVFYVVI